jgi:hypothetical protein
MGIAGKGDVTSGLSEQQRPESKHKPDRDDPGHDPRPADLSPLSFEVPIAFRPSADDPQTRTLVFASRSSYAPEMKRRAGAPVADRLCVQF